MNRLFGEGGLLSEPMREAEIALRDPERPAIVLVTWDDPGSTNDPMLLRREIQWEMAARLFGKRYPFEYDFAALQEHSLPRFCRTITRKPACVFAYNLEILREDSAERYETALTLLNQQREDFRQTGTSLLLLLRKDIADEVMRRAPDFADWRTASLSFIMPRGESVPGVAVKGLLLWEADDLRRQAQRLEKSIGQAKDNPTLQADFQKRLSAVWRQLGQLEQSQRAFAAAASTAARAKDTEELRRLYLDYIITSCENVNPRGIAQTNRTVTLPLDTVYISLTAERETTRDVALTPGEEAMLPSQNPREVTRAALDRSARREVIREKIDLPRAVRDNSRLVILGDPGAGKTTLTRFLAYRFARACRNQLANVLDSEGNDYGEPRLPIRIRIADFAEAFGKNNALTVRDFLPHGFPESGIAPGDLADLFEDAFTEDGALVLLDGLDEIADVKNRIEIARRIDQFAGEVALKSRVLVTSRIAGYNEARLGTGFAVCTLREIEREQIERFLENWCAAVEKFHTPDAPASQREARAVAERNALLHAIDTAEGVRRLVGNPLLLTILALIHRNGGRLPERRVELYKLASETLLRDWRLEQARAQARPVTQTEADSLLAPLAYWMHENEPTGLIEQEKAVALLCQWLAESRNLAPDDTETRDAVQDFLCRVSEQSGLLVERAPGKFGFLHLTFEEYFAANYIVSDFLEAAERINAHRHQARWQEVIRLAIASERPKNAAHLIRAAIWNPDSANAKTSYAPSAYESLLHRDILLAARCLSDCDGLDASLTRSIVHQTIALYVTDQKQNRVDSLDRALQSVFEGMGRSEAGAVAATELLPLLKSSDPFVVRLAAQALGQLGVKTDMAADALLQQLKSSNTEDVRDAATVLGRLGVKTDNVINALIALLKSGDTNTVLNAVWTLGQLGVKTDNVIDALIALLERRDAYAAAQVLGQLDVRTDSVIDALLQQLKSSNTNAVLSAAEVLGQLGVKTDNVIDALAALLESGDLHIVLNAARVLGRLGVKTNDVINALIALLECGDVGLVLNAARVLESLSVKTDKAANAIMQHFNSRNGILIPKDSGLEFLSAGRLLGRLGVKTDNVINALIALLKSADTNAVLNAVEALGTLGVKTDNVIDALAVLLKTGNVGLVLSAAQALRQLGAKKDETANALVALLERSDADVFPYAAQAMGQLGIPQQRAMTVLATGITNANSFLIDGCWTALLAMVQKAEEEGISFPPDAYQ